ncbi:hypothetical protein [Magnetofaba australis]|nr:hypothetical protein [Magnetofaba australis]
MLWTVGVLLALTALLIWRAGSAPSLSLAPPAKAALGDCSLYGR